MSTINIKYVGKKAIKADNVAGTEHVWRHGEVRAVEVSKAAVLLQHPDCWAAVTATPIAEDLAAEAKRQAEAQSLKPKPPKEDEDEDIDPTEPLTKINLSEFTKAQLLDYAKQKYRVDLADNLRKSELIGRVLDLQRASTPQRRLK